MVIRILIALQINNWNEDRKEKISEKEFIKGIKNDLKKDKEYMKLIINTVSPKTEVYGFLGEELK